jgi:hypothetical protein
MDMLQQEEEVQGLRGEEGTKYLTLPLAKLNKYVIKEYHFNFINTKFVLNAHLSHF